MTTRPKRGGAPLTLFAVAAVAALAWEIGSDGHSEDLKVGGEIVFIIAAILLVAVSIRRWLRARGRRDPPPT